MFLTRGKYTLSPMAGQCKLIQPNQEGNLVIFIKTTNVICPLTQQSHIWKFIPTNMATSITNDTHIWLFMEALFINERTEGKTPFINRRLVR